MSRKRFGRRRISRNFVFKMILLFGFIVITPYISSSCSCNLERSRLNKILDRTACIQTVFETFICLPKSTLLHCHYSTLLASNHWIQFRDFPSKQRMFTSFISETRIVVSFILQTLIYGKFLMISCQGVVTGVDLYMLYLALWFSSVWKVFLGELYGLYFPSNTTAYMLKAERARILVFADVTQCRGVYVP